MKKRSIYILLFFVGILLGGCDNADDGGYAKPITIYEKVKGDWSLTSIKMVDEYAKANSIKPDEQDLTNWFNYNTFVLQLNVDEENIPTSYKVLGEVPALFSADGFWDLSSAFTNTDLSAVKINLYTDVSKTQRTDQLLLISTPGSNEKMEVQLVRKANQVTYASYIFTLTPAN